MVVDECFRVVRFFEWDELNALNVVHIESGHTLIIKELTKRVLHKVLGDTYVDTRDAVGQHTPFRGSVGLEFSIYLPLEVAVNAERQEGEEELDGGSGWWSGWRTLWFGRFVVYSTREDAVN